MYARLGLDESSRRDRYVSLSFFGSRDSRIAYEIVQTGNTLPLAGT